jgi:hypothetical protein
MKLRLDVPRKRTRLFFAIAAACLIVTGPGLAFAKDKSAPAPDWALAAAKTPTPANVGDAPAVMLLEEHLITVDAQNHAVERERYAVRILKPQGRSEAHCVAEYDTDAKLNYFRSWTITADGSQFQAKETDFRDVGAYADRDMQFSDRFRTVNPPAGDPGAVVVCEMEGQLRPYMSEEDWQIQWSIPVVSTSLELVLPPGGHYAESWSRFTPVKPTETAGNHLRWEIKDVPALDLDKIYSTPPWQALAARMSVKWGDAAVKSVNDQWRAIGLWQEKLEEHRFDPTAEITAKAQELTAGAPDLYTKLSLITDYIQKNIRYFIVTRGIGGWQAHYATDIYRNRYGDCKDKTTLLISMLQAIGIRAHYLHVDSSRGVINPEAPSLAGNHMIIAIELPDGESDPRLPARVKANNGKTLLIFDPTDEVTPVGLIRSALQAAWGNLANGADSQVLQMPVLPPETAGLNRKGNFTLTADGSLAGDVTEVFSGDDATRERSTLKDSEARDTHDRLEKDLGSQLPGVAFKGYEYRHTDDLAKPLDLDLHLSGANYAHVSGPLLLVRPRVLGSHIRAVSDVMEGKPRTYPIEIGHPGKWHDSFDISFPEGYVVDETPDPVEVNMDFASYKSAVSVKGNQIHYERDYVVRQVEISPDKAADFRKFENTILFDEKSSVVLKKK